MPGECYEHPPGNRTKRQSVKTGHPFSCILSSAVELSTEIREARHKLGLTQEAAARKWGIPLATLRKYEQGQRRPRGLAMKMLRQILDTVEPVDATPPTSSVVPEAPVSSPKASKK